MKNKSIFPILFMIWTLSFYLIHEIKVWDLSDRENKSYFIYILCFFVVFSLIFLMTIKMASIAIYSLKKEKKASVSIIILFFIFWALAILTINGGGLHWKSIYYSIVNTANPLAASFLFFGASYGLGKKMLNFFQIREFSATETFLISEGLGIVLVGNIFFLIAILKIAYSSVAYLIIIGILIFCFSEIRNFFRQVIERRYVIHFERKIRQPLEKIAKLLIIIILLITFIYSQANLINAGWDTFHQYLTFPKVYQENHGLVYFPYHPHWGFPQSGEMIYLGSILLGNVASPFVFAFIFFILSFLSLASTIKKDDNKLNIWIISIFISIPTIFVFLTGYLKIEPILIFYVILVFLLIRNRNFFIKNSKTWILLGIFLGFLVTLKYTFLIFILSIFLSLFIFRKNFALTWKKMLMMCSIVLVLFSPWMIKNWYYYQSPFYPLFSGQDYFQQNLNLNCNKQFNENCKEDIFITGDSMNLKNENFLISNFLIGAKPLFLGNIFNLNNPGPFIIMFLPIVFYGSYKSREKYVKFLVLTGIIFCALGIIFFSGQIWYYIPALIIYLIILSFCWDYIYEKKIMTVLILIWMSLAIISYFFRPQMAVSFKYLQGEISYMEGTSYIEEKDGEQTYDWNNVWNFVNQNILNKEQHGLIYAYADTQGYFIKDSYKNYIPDFFGYLFRCLSKDGMTYINLKKLNVEYFMFNLDNFKRCIEETSRDKYYVCQTNEKFIEFLANHGKLIYNSGDIFLYQFE